MLTTGSASFPEHPRVPKNPLAFAGGEEMQLPCPGEVGTAAAVRQGSCTLFRAVSGVGEFMVGWHQALSPGTA